MAQKKNKDYNYFEYFKETANYICETATMLQKILAEFDYSTYPERMNEVHVLENRADAAKHDMIQNLAHEFITPIEREDIVALAQELDNVVDCLDDVARRIYMFDIHEIRQETYEFTSLILEECDALRLVINEFANFKSSKGIKDLIVSVNNLESRGDALHSRCIHDLYRSGKSDREVMIWTNIFEDLENCLDSGEDCVDIIESVIMKNT